VRFQYQRKNSRCHREPRVWLNNHKGLLPGLNQPGQQNQEHAIGPAKRWPFHLPPENNELLAEEGIFRHELRFASAEINEGGEQQGAPERFGPTSKARGDRIPAAILQPPERGKTPAVLVASPSCERIVDRA